MGYSPWGRTGSDMTLQQQPGGRIIGSLADVVSHFSSGSEWPVWLHSEPLSPICKFFWT